MPTRAPDGRRWSEFRRSEVSKRNALIKSRAKTSTKNGKVRRLDNGLLDVSRKGKYPKMITENSKSGLLGLPAEIRNKIFTYAVGGHEFEISGLSYSKGKFPSRTWSYVPWVKNKKKQCFGLLRVCRQVYYETALLPFQTSIFCVPDFSYNSGRLTDFFQDRLAVERDNVTTIQLKQFLSRDEDDDHTKAGRLSGLTNLKYLDIVYEYVEPVPQCPWLPTKMDEDQQHDLKKRYEAIYPGLTVLIHQKLCGM